MNTKNVTEISESEKIRQEEKFRAAVELYHMERREALFDFAFNVAEALKEVEEWLDTP
jgi:hypothetical protein